MENQFKIGDIVRFNPNHVPNAKFKDKFREEFVIKGFAPLAGIPDAYVVIEIDIGQGPGEKTMFRERFKLANPHAIMVGDFVVAKIDLGVSLVKGKRYLVQGVDKLSARVKIVGIRNWLRMEYFANQHANLNKEPEPVKPKEPDVGEKLLQELKDKVAGNADTCSYVIRDKDDKKAWHVRDACHARMSLSHQAMGTPTHVALNISGHLNKHPLPDAYKAWVKYIVFESSFKQMFLPTTLEKALDSGVLLDVNKTISEITAAAVALRVGSECPPQCKMFYDMVELGFSPNVACVAATMFSRDGKGDWSLCGNSGGHHFVRNNLDFDGVLNFFNKGVTNPALEEEPYHKVNTRGYVVCNALAPNAEVKDNYFRQKLTTLRGGALIDTGWGEKAIKFQGKNASIKLGAALSQYFN